MKDIDTTKLLLLALVLMMAWNNFFKKSEVAREDPITITIPEFKGSTGRQVVKEYVPYPVYSGDGKSNFDVDADLKKKYEESQDSISKYKQYLEAIKINKYEETLVDNDSVEIKGYATTRGDLLNYSVDYRIKPLQHSYVPKIVKELPRLSLGLGAESGVPTIPNTEFIIKGGISLLNRKGREISVSYDTQNRIWLGYKKNFKIIK